MKCYREKAKFRPITIVLETPEELEYFRCLLADVPLNKRQLKLDEKFGDDWYNTLHAFLILP